MKGFNFKRTDDSFFVRKVRDKDETYERKFYEHCRSSFKRMSGTMSFYGPKDSDDIFQDAFLVVWTEIQNGKIFAEDGKVFRMNEKGESSEMRCSLATFVNDIARNLWAKSNRHDGPGKVSDITKAIAIFAENNTDAYEREVRMRVVEECVSSLSKRCVEILTMFYFKKMSMEEIVFARKENVSANGVKTSKNKCMNKLKSDIYTKIGYGF
ncbi:MAG: RNA polymerase sigma factor [Candidatus Cryptobacteroides sp.]